MGVPSKYFALPDSSLGRIWAVTLKRASLVRPQRTKKVRKIVSTADRKPTQKASAAGARPKDIYIGGRSVIDND